MFTNYTNANKIDFNNQKAKDLLMRTSSFKLSSLLLLAIGLTQFNAAAQTNASTPIDVGTVVNGFQDNFTAATRDPAWMVVNAYNEDTYVQTNGVLRVFPPIPADYENPNHLIYNPTNVTYNGAVQEVLARIRAVNWQYFENNEGDLLFGIALSCQATNNPSSGNLGGYCWMFADADGNAYMGDPEIGRVHGYQARLLDDYTAWGPGTPFLWTTNQWYWMRLGSDGTTLSAKIWPDDAVTREPTNAQLTWTENGRTGFAGITGSHVPGVEFEVDYFLLKASGLPSITVKPTANPLYFTSVPQSSTNAVGTSATFSITVSNLAPVTYQWLVAPSNSTAFTAITGATNASYTTPALTLADNGNQYSVLVTEGALSDVSQVATVTIDTTPFTLVSATSSGSSTQVVLQFNKSVQVPANANGFSASGLHFSTVAQGVLPSQLVLSSSALSFGTAYTLQASGVESLAGNILAATNLAISQVLQMPAEFGTTVNGYQDDFTGASLNTNWVTVPSDPAVLAQFTQANGMLTFATDTNVGGYDPEHLLYEPATPYDSANQEVLARIRINSAYPPDAEVRVGVGALCDPASSPVPGLGAEAVFDDWPYGFAYNGVMAVDLVDYQFANVVENVTSAGPAPTNAIYVQYGQWYWIREKCTSGNHIAVKFWPADGVTPEPATFPQQDGFTPSKDSPLYAGISAASAGAVENFDVDYILIKAAGLPSISVTPPSDLSFGPYITFTEQPVGGVVAVSTPFTLTATAAGSGTLTLQWQSAPPGSSTFTDISGQTSTNLTVTLTIAQSGTQYRCLASVPGLTLASATATIFTGPPILLSAQTLGSPTNVTLTFNRAMQTPGSASGFTLNNNATVSSVAAGASSDVLVLTTSTLSLGTTYTLTVSGVQDAYGNALVTTNITVNFTVYLPAEVGASVAGYQDDFTAATLDTNWIALGIDAEQSVNLFIQNGDGLLHVLSPTNSFPSNPNRLLYNGPAYDAANQEVLMRFRITSFAPGGGAGLDSIGGVAVANTATNPGTSTDYYGAGSGGIDWLLGDDTGDYTDVAGFQAVFLDDWAAWGPAISFQWTSNTWYWMRLLQNGTNTNSSPNIFGKIWLADGTAPEPAAWQLTWSRGERTGLAGIAAGSDQFYNEIPFPLFTFDVSYFLLKADGLPKITVAPSSFSLVPPLSPLQFTAIQPSSNDVVLQWTGAGTLQQATSLAGPWVDMVDPNGAYSPYTIPASSPAMFYRLRQ
jgi:hypothetical protein